MNWVSRILPLLISLVIFGLAPVTIRSSIVNQQHKMDLAEINHIRYGIFSINAWKVQISQIIFSEIKKLDLNATAKELKSTVERQLSALIDKLNEKIKEANRGSLGGKMRQLLINIVVDIEDVKKGVPGYADTLIAEISKPEVESKVKEMAAEQLKAYFDKTFEEQDMSLVDQAVARAGAKDVPGARLVLVPEIQKLNKQLDIQMWLLIGLSIGLFAWAGAQRRIAGFTYALLFPTLLILLAVGVTTPMIDLEAKVSEMSFNLLGHKVLFENQILYFQSKSVLDVFWLMITHQDVSMKFVGILMVLFSVVFPLLKLASSGAHYFNFKDARENKFVKFFVFKSGKWSMADVMVVAIFMAYIGFNGVIASQFVKMKKLAPTDIVFMTTNGTTLQLGFFVFLTYAVLALFLSNYLLRTSEASAQSASR